MDKDQIVCARENIPALLDMLEAETKRADESEKLRNTLTVDFSRFVTSLSADRDRWKARAEALEQLVRKLLPETATACNCCAYRDGPECEEPCEWCIAAEGNPGWEFNEARFGGDEK